MIFIYNISTGGVYMNSRSKEIIKTSIIGIIGNLLLVVIKGTIGFLSSSISIIMDGVNNLTDAGSSTIAIIGTKLANKTPDKKHPYGHGRIEDITSFLIGGIILFAGGLAIYESITSLIDYFETRTIPSFTTLSLVIIGVAILIKGAIAIYYRKQGQKLKSDVLKASGIDAMFDMLLSTATLVGAILAKTLGIYIEGYLGIIIGIFILKSGFEIVKEALSHLIGERVDEEFKTKIKNEVLDNKQVISVHDLIINSYGNGMYIASIHITVDDNLMAGQIQKLEREIATVIYQKYNVILTIGIYTLGESNEESKAIKKEVLSYIANNPDILELHGFNVDLDKMVVIFDLVISFNLKDPNAYKKELEDYLKRLYPAYQFFCTIDKDF